MRPFVLALALIIAAVTVAVAPGPAAAGKKARALKLAQPSVALTAGVVIDSTSELAVDMTVKMKQGDFPVKLVRSTPYAVELLEVSDEVIKRARVVYGAATEAQPMQQPTATVTAGNTYLLAFGASGIQVTRPDGTAVTGAELTTLQKEHADLGRGFKLRKLLVGKTFKPGKKVKLEPAQFGDVFGTPDDMTIESFSIRFDGRHGDVATFSYWVVMSADDSTRTFSMKGGGTFTIDIPRVLALSFTLDGPLSGEVAQGADTMTITGTMSGRGSKAYR